MKPNDEITAIDGINNEPNFLETRLSHELRVSLNRSHDDESLIILRAALRDDSSLGDYGRTKEQKLSSWILESWIDGSVSEWCQGA